MGFLKLPVELFFWLSAMTILAVFQPADAPFSLCLFKWIGLPFCPGCGLGHSIIYFFQGDLIKSFQAHPFGLFAIAVITRRVTVLMRLHWNVSRTNIDYNIHSDLKSK